MNSSSLRTAGLALVFFLTAYFPFSFAASAAEPSGKMTLTSPDFSAGGNIPSKFTCDGEDTSPALKWNDPPAGTKSFALIVDDPDAPVGTWVHWVIYNLPATARGLSSGTPKEAELTDGSRQGENDFKRPGFGGPCPPPGPAHRYFFKLYALDSMLSNSPGMSKQQLEKAMQGHILARVELVGRYKRGSK